MSPFNGGQPGMGHRKKRRPSLVRIAAAALMASLVLAFTAACTSSSTASQSPASVSGTAAATDTTSETTGSSMPEVSIPAPATTPVPPTQAGDTNQTVAEVPVTTMPAIQVTESAEIGTGVTVEVEDVKAVTGTARGPGEVGGPAAAVTVKITNSSAVAIPLNQVQVTAEDSAGTPAPSLSGDPAAPMSGNLDAGQDASGVYVFSLGQSHQNPLKLAISYGAGAPVALYTADVSN